MHRFKTSVMLVSVFFGFLFLFLGRAEADTSEVKIQINDCLLSFPDVKPFISEHNQTFVPLRTVSEQLGADIDWSKKGEDIFVHIKKGTTSISLTTNHLQAFVNEKETTLTDAPIFSNGQVLVPLHLISDAFGIRTQWDNPDGIAILDVDNAYHAPAWYKPSPPSEQDLLLADAKSYLGTRYLAGGTSPSGFDCSGFVHYIFSRHGVDLPRSSSSMYKEAGYFVSEPEPGDLVFFTGHVGIYLGDDEFISSATHYGIKIDSLSGPYWNSHYLGAKRIL